MVFPAVRFEPADGQQQGRPLDVVDSSAHVVQSRKQIEILDVQNARRLVRAFDQSSKVGKMPAHVVGHGPIQDAIEQQA